MLFGPLCFGLGVDGITKLCIFNNEREEGSCGEAPPLHLSSSRRKPRKLSSLALQVYVLSGIPTRDQGFLCVAPTNVKAVTSGVKNN